MSEAAVPPNAEVLAESNGARLVRLDGSLRCFCPFLCEATFEPCEFKPPDHRSTALERAADAYYGASQ